ncbi:MAG: M67 family metallopeptidase [Candidatus Promineifilaceae bacterium]
MLLLDQNVRATIASLAAESYPFEGCGLLIGSVEDGSNVVEAVFPVPNVWAEKEERRARFRIDEIDMVNAELEAAAQGLDVIGIYHSHPDHPPIASPRDLAWATWPGYSYLITEVREGKPGHSKSWQLLADRSGFYEEEIELIG